jgi:serine/threonine-protein phosphatase PGAM5
MRYNNYCTLIISILLSLILISNGGCQSSKNVKKGTRTIYLIRHGFYNESDNRDEFIGKELTSLGIAQARLVAARLKGMPVKFTSLISSTMTRARQTAMVINEDFPELKLKQDELICECTPPSWRKDVMAGVDTTERDKCAENLENAFKKYFIPSPDSSGSNDIIVCHGNVIRYFVTKVLKVDPMSWLQMSIANCSLTIVRIKPDRSIKLVSFNDVGHIPLNLQTETGGNNEMKELIIH